MLGQTLKSKINRLWDKFVGLEFEGNVQMLTLNDDGVRELHRLKRERNLEKIQEELVGIQNKQNIFSLILAIATLILALGVVFDLSDKVPWTQVGLGTNSVSSAWFRYIIFTIIILLIGFSLGIFFRTIVTIAKRNKK